MWCCKRGRVARGRRRSKAIPEEGAYLRSEALADIVESWFVCSGLVFRGLGWAGTNAVVDALCCSVIHVNYVRTW